MSDEQQDNDADLYDDLDMTASSVAVAASNKASSAAAAATSTKTTTNHKQSSSSLLLSSLPATTNLQAHAEHLSQKVEQLSSENATLRQNMGLLFRTARAELQRKDDEIARLQAELDTFNSNKNRAE